MNREDTSQERKLQLSGGSTYIISLPKNWIDIMDIKVGDHMTIVRNPNLSLTLFAGGRRHLPESDAIIDTGRSDTAESIKRKILATYLRGFKSIRIRSKGMRIQVDHSKAVKDLVRTSMIGTEIVESSSEEITIQVLTRLPELSFDVALKRMHRMTANMHMEAMEALAEADTAHAEEIINMDDEVDRFSLYMRRNLAIAIENARMLQDIGIKRAADCLGYRTVISRIERIADHAVLVSKRIKFMDGRMRPGVMGRVNAIAGSALKVFEDAMEALDRKDYSMAEHVTTRIQDIIDQEKSIMANVDDSVKNAGVIRFVLEDIRRVAEYSRDIAEVVIDENIESAITK